MAETGTGRARLVEMKLASASRRRRLRELERVLRAIEDELSDDELSDEQKLQNIGERVAGVMA